MSAKGQMTDYTFHTVGNLKCLYKLRIAKPHFWNMHYLSNDTLEDSCYEEFRLAFIEVLEPVRYGPFGEMIPGPEIAKCKLPFGDTAEARRYASHGGRVMEINLIDRTAHLIPVHIDPSTPDLDKAWIHNNRIDLGSWDIVYGEQS